MPQISRLPRLGGAAAIAAAALGLSGCMLIVDGDGDADFSFGWDNHDYRNFGAVYDADILSDQVVFRVKSNGCTDKDDFETIVDREDGVYEIGIDRIDSDHCKARVPDGVEISYDFGELGVPNGSEVKILNPIRD